MTPSPTLPTATCPPVPSATAHGLAILRRARTVSRLRQAGLSNGALATLLPDGYAPLGEAVGASGTLLVLALVDGRRS